MQQITLILFFLSAFFPSLKAQISFSKISDSLWVYHSNYTYSGSLKQTNGMLCITSVGAVLIDTPHDSIQVVALHDSIEKKFKQKIIALIVSHAHADRVSTINYFKKALIPTYSTRASQQICFENRLPAAQFTFHQDSVFTFGNSKIELFYPGSGHSSDNMLIYFKKERLLFTGSFTISTAETDLGFLADANIGMWPIALKRASKQFNKRKTVVSSSGTWNGNAFQHTLKLLRKKY